MNFLSPALLFLAAAALVPLLIHLLRKRIARTIEFPAARYLARAERENSRTLRMRNLLLMLLRVAAVLLIALAAARPIGRVVGVGHPPTAIAIVLDNSLSSSVIIDGRPLLEQLRDAALDLVDGSTSADRIWLISAGGEATTGSHAVVREAISSLRASAGSGDMSLALSRAIAVVDGAGLAERRIALLTDAQRFEWSGVTRVDAGRIPVNVFSPIVVVPPNRSVSAVDVRPSRWTPLGEVAARVVTADSLSWRLDLGDRPLARGTAAPGEEIVVRGSPQERGWTSGFVEIQPDEFRADDVRHFAVWIGAAPSVRVSNSAGVFVASAVDALIEAGRVERGESVRLSAADDLDRLPAMIFPPEDPVRIGVANRTLERLGVPWRFGEASRTSGSVRPAEGTGWTDDGIVAELRYRLERVGAGDGDTLARVGVEPWIVAGEQFVIFASPLNPDATNLPVRASFISLLAELVSQRLAGDAGGVIHAFPGSTVPRPRWADAISAGDTAPARTLTSSTFSAPLTSGVFQLSSAGRRTGALVVNPPAGEFELGRLPMEELRNRFDGERVSFTADAQRWLREVFEGTGRRPLVIPLLLLALGALAIESLVSRDSGFRRKV